MSPASLSAPARTVAEWEPHLSAWALQLLNAGRSEATTAGYVHHVRALALDLQSTASDPWAVTPAMLAHYFQRQHWSQSTRRRVLVSLRAFYGWALAHGLAARSPLAGLPETAPKTRGPQALSLPPAWAEHAAAWAAYMRAGGRAESTITVRLGWLRRIAGTYADPFAITGDDLAVYLSRSDWSAETKRSARGAAATFYRWAIRTGRTEHNPADELDAVRVPRALPRPAPDEAVVAALAASDDRTRLMLMLAGLAGLRRAEVAAVHTADFAHHEYLRVRGKGGRDRLVPLHPDLSHALTSVVARRRQGTDPGTGWTVAGTDPGWLFPSDRAGQHLSPDYVGRLITDALPHGWTTHTLRHRFATQAYGAARDLRAVQELLGHAKPETTARYAAVPDHSLATAVNATTMGYPRVHY